MVCYYRYPWTTALPEVLQNSKELSFLKVPKSYNFGQTLSNNWFHKAPRLQKKPFVDFQTSKYSRWNIKFVAISNGEIKRQDKLILVQIRAIASFGIRYTRAVFRVLVTTSWWCKSQNKRFRTGATSRTHVLGTIRETSSITFDFERFRTWTLYALLFRGNLPPP